MIIAALIVTATVSLVLSWVVMHFVVFVPSKLAESDAALFRAHQRVAAGEEPHEALLCELRGQE